MALLKKSIRVLLKTILGFVVFVATYALAAFLLSVIAVKREVVKEVPTIAIFISTNGDHTDIIVPVKNKLVDWSKTLRFENTISKDTTAQYLALGWGDKGFYLNTPTWAQLKFSTAFRAMFGLSSAAVHSTYYKSIREDKDCIRMMLTEQQYTRLIEYVQNSFKTDAAGQIINIKTTANYDNNDAFYEAKGRYNLFYTCNTWANNALKSAGQTACVWTPFDRGIFYHYRH